jgi:hypothetical protein
VRRREIRRDGERPFDQLDGALVPPALMRDQPEQVERVGVIGGLLQHPSIERLGPVTPARLVVGKGRLKVAEHLGCPPGILWIAWGCHL